MRESPISKFLFFIVFLVCRPFSKISGIFIILLFTASYFYLGWEFTLICVLALIAGFFPKVKKFIIETWNEAGEDYEFSNEEMNNLGDWERYSNRPQPEKTSKKSTVDAAAQMWTGIALIILGIILTPVLIGIPMIILGFWHMIAGLMKR